MTCLRIRFLRLLSYKDTTKISYFFINVEVTIQYTDLIETMNFVINSREDMTGYLCPKLNSFLKTPGPSHQP